MRFLVAVAAAALLSIAAPAEAQESYTASATVGQVADFRQYVLAINRGTCRKYSLAATCTQAQACTAANAAGGASCTAAQARAASARIWPDTQAGREEFMTFVWLVPKFNEAKSSLPSQANADYCAWWSASNQTTKDAECSKIGAPNGCS